MSLDYFDIKKPLEIIHHQAVLFVPRAGIEPARFLASV